MSFIKLKYLFLSVFCIGLRLLPAQQMIPKGKILFEDRFDKLGDHWVLETQSANPAKLLIDSGRMIIDAGKDATVWLDQPLSGNLLIDCYREVWMRNGAHDRLSDMNFFWMATDPRNNHLFTRKGIFKEYDSLQLYYAGIGGNNNATTRFRKYAGDGSKPILQEYTDTQHLLKPNHRYHIQILIRDGLTECRVDDEVWFSYSDPHPLRNGFLGFRTTKSRQVISGLKIYRIH